MLGEIIKQYGPLNNGQTIYLFNTLDGFAVANVYEGVYFRLRHFSDYMIGGEVYCSGLEMAEAEYRSRMEYWSRPLHKEIALADAVLQEINAESGKWIESIAKHPDPAQGFSTLADHIETAREELGAMVGELQKLETQFKEKGI